MYLKQLEMNGFKSFVESRLFFQPGITAVVGPNGTGKSNILDAILWVLGEQSTKAMRSERMEDVIFNGTESRMAPDEQEPFAVGFKTPHLLPLPPLSLSSSGMASESFSQYVNLM